MVTTIRVMLREGKWVFFLCSQPTRRAEISYSRICEWNCGCQLILNAVQCMNGLLVERCSRKCHGRVPFAKIEDLFLLYYLACLAVIIFCYRAGSNGRETDKPVLPSLRERHWDSYKKNSITTTYILTRFDTPCDLSRFTTQRRHNHI